MTERECVKMFGLSESASFEGLRRNLEFLRGIFCTFKEATGAVKSIRALTLDEWMRAVTLLKACPKGGWRGLSRVCLVLFPRFISRKEKLFPLKPARM